VPAPELLSLIDTNETQIEGAGINLLSYLAPGDAHTVLSDGTFYTETVNGVKLVDWVTGLINGDNVVDVHTARTAQLAEQLSWSANSSLIMPRNPPAHEHARGAHCPRTRELCSCRSARRIVECDFDHRRDVDQHLERLLVPIPSSAQVLENGAACCHILNS
jgi:hypothetical protein